MEWTDRCMDSRSKICTSDISPSVRRHNLLPVQPLKTCTHKNTQDTSRVNVWAGRKVTTTTLARAVSCLHPHVQTIRDETRCHFCGQGLWEAPPETRANFQGSVETCRRCTDVCVCACLKLIGVFSPLQKDVVQPLCSNMKIWLLQLLHSLRKQS